jgi:hypothetical protein
MLRKFNLCKGKSFKDALVKPLDESAIGRHPKPSVSNI